MEKSEKSITKVRGNGAFCRCFGWLAAAVACAAMLASCSSGGSKGAYVTFYTGAVSVSRGGHDLPLQVKTPVLDGDIVRVGEKSYLMIQSDDGLVVRVEADTQAELRITGNDRKREVVLQKGRILSMVGKLQKSNGYRVVTPTTVAAVRGTQFLTEFDGKRSVVAVSDGKVSVTASAKDEKIVEKGTSAVVEEQKAETVSLRPHSAVEALELSKLGSTPVVENIAAKQPDQIRAVFGERVKNDEKINSQIEDESGLSPEKMKAKYGRIDELTLYTGQVISGVIVARGETFKVLTRSGAVYIDAKDIQNTETK